MHAAGERAEHAEDGDAEADPACARRRERKDSPDEREQKAQQDASPGARPAMNEGVFGGSVGLLTIHARLIPGPPGRQPAGRGGRGP